MIQWPHLLIALLSICSVSAKFTIDWTSCAKETQCHLLDQCITTNPTDDNKLKVHYGTSPPVNAKCLLGIQIKPYTEEKALYFVQVNQALQTKNISIYHGNELILNCYEDNGKVAIEEEILAQYNPKLYEDLSYFDSDQSMCAFTMEKLTILKKKLTVLTSIRFDETSLPYVTEGNALFQMSKVFCDPDSMQDSGDRHGFDVRPVRYKARMSLDCSNYKTDLGLPYDYRLFIQSEGKEPSSTTKLECDRALMTYKYKNGSEDVSLTESFTAYCAVELSKTCKNTLNCTGLCPRLVPASNEENAELQCDGGKWLIDGKYYEGLETVCNTNDDNVAVFTIKMDNSEQELTTGQCFKDYDCKAKGHLDVEECDDKKEKDGECSKIVFNEAISCANQEFYLVIFSGTSIRNDTRQFKCDLQNGLYKSTTDPSVTIPLNSRIACRKEKEEKSEPLSSASKIGPKEAALIAIGVVVVITAIIFLVVFKGKHIKGYLCNMKRIFEWKHMSPSSKIVEAQAVFAKAALAQVNQEVTILQGLKLLDTILKYETEEPDIWKAIDPFIKRIQTVAYFKDIKLERLFNRYCYLQARKIIDKHGWISPNPVTKLNPTGYIRVCAIQLLAIARKDDLDAQRMVLEGFKALRFKAVEQYPHCGVLWAVVVQQRVGNPSLQYQLIGYLNHLLKLRCAKTTVPPFDDIPEENQFPLFGSIKNQLAFALGATDIIPGMHTSLQITDDISINRSIIAGTCHPTSGSTSTTLFFHLNPEKTESKKWAVLLEWPEMVEQMIPMMVFQRRPREAQDIWKKFQLRETSEGRNPRNFFLEAKETYIQFVEAIKSESKGIVGWLRGKIAKEERKKLKRKTETTPKLQQCSSLMQVKDGPNGQFIDKYVESYGKEWNVKRITTCNLTATEESRLREKLQLLLSSKTIEGLRTTWSVAEVADIFDKVLPIFESEPLFMEDVPAGITVVGDLHGQSYDLARILEQHAKDGKPGYECAKFLFLGDFVDRGSQILETVLTLFILKILYPDRFIILRGNHEFVNQNSHSHTYREIEERYHSFASEYVYHRLNEALAFMPVCAVIGGEIFCVHGGVSSLPMTRQDLRQLRKPLVEDSMDKLVADILWADPQKGLKGFSFNDKRHCSISYGEDFLAHVLERMECTSIIRAHQVMLKGYSIPWPNCLSIFDASCIDHRHNSAAFVRIADDLKYQIVVLKADLIREEEEVRLYGKKKLDEVSQREILAGGAAAFDSGEIDDFLDDDD